MELFYLLKNFFKMDQVFELVLESDNFLAIFEKYSCFEVSIKIQKFIWREQSFF